MHMRVSWMICLVAASSVTMAQTWMSSYEDGLAKARKQDWAASREAFKKATAFRTEDQSRETTLPGPATDRRTWRNGAPYSPNFLAAYTGIKAALAMEEPDRKNQLKTCGAELEALLTKGQTSAEAFYCLNLIYTSVGDTSARMKLDERVAQAAGKMTWKVDTEPVTPEDVAAVNQLVRSSIDQPGVETPVVVTGPGTGTTNTGAGTGSLTPAGTRVPTIPSKFALIIGNSESRVANGAVPFAADDAQVIRESLLANAGYAEPNVDLVVNATADAMRAAVKALAERVPEGGTVFIFFSGVGANLDGKDYLAGVDTESPTDSSSMMAKSEIYKAFMAKGARIFAFFQANRTMANGRYFGMEVPLVGSIAQCQATIPGESIQSVTRNGTVRGLYADALVGTFGEIRSNRIPIQEFGWQVFYRMRRGDSGTVGGGSRQTPTLPVLTNLGSDARF
jgi:hypothetical protein